METVLRAYECNLAYARALVSDLSDEDMACAAGVGLENHPAFTLGHLVTGAAMVASELGLEMDLPDGWSELFERRGPGDSRLPDDGRETKYPGKDELLAELERQHHRAADAIRTADSAMLDQPCEWRLDRWLPTVRDLLTFLCTSHEAMHLGQLAAWRRAKGLPAAMGGM